MWQAAPCSDDLVYINDSLLATLHVAVGGLQQLQDDVFSRLSGGRTDMWRAWIGFNFSHSLGVLLFATLAIWAGVRIKMLPAGITAALTLIGCVYLALALRYWFSAPAIGIAIGTSCFAASLR